MDWRLPCWSLRRAKHGRTFFKYYFENAFEGKFPDRLYQKEYDWGVLVIHNDDVLYFNSGPDPIHVLSPTFCMGSGRDFAMAAIHLGKNAIEAVEVANALSLSCGFGVDFINYK